MSCKSIGSAIVCGSWDNPDCIRYLACPTCGKRRRMLMHYAGAWYGHDLTCLTCGATEADGIWGGANPGRATTARQRARRAVGRREYNARVDADLREIFDDEDGAK